MGLCSFRFANDGRAAAAIEEATALAALDVTAYGRMMREFGGETLVLMADQIATERAD